jgi:hypothetical protein
MANICRDWVATVCLACEVAYLDQWANRQLKLVLIDYMMNQWRPAVATIRIPTYRDESKTFGTESP